MNTSSRIDKSEEDVLASKNRYQKVVITDTAIDKIPRIEYKGFSSLRDC